MTSVLEGRTSADTRYVVRRVAAYFIDVTVLTGSVQSPQWALYLVTGGFPLNRLAEMNNGWLIYGLVLPVYHCPSGSTSSFSSEQRKRSRRLRHAWTLNNQGGPQ